MTVTKYFISYAARVLDLGGDINSLFVLITMLIFHAYKKNFTSIFFTFCGGLSSKDMFFSEKLILKNF